MVLLKNEAQRFGLDRIVSINGWTKPADLRQMLTSINAAIVPTRSEFNEGMAMSAIEPVLMGRPVITNPVVPALELLRSACVVALTDDIESYSIAIIGLLENPNHYFDLVRSCHGLQESFYDGSRSLRTALNHVFRKIQTKRSLD
jgi:glycosyltransferase involved in cell wall biosynthesis